MLRLTEGAQSHFPTGQTLCYGETPRRAAEYYLGFHRILNEEVEQVILFASQEELTMSSVFETRSMRYVFRIPDIKSLDGEPLLASDDWGDNILALLTPAEQERVLHREADAPSTLLNPLTTIAVSTRGSSH